MDSNPRCAQKQVFTTLIGAKIQTGRDFYAPNSRIFEILIQRRSRDRSLDFAWKNFSCGPGE
ncbi:MAG TPA: hypothetical protein VN281_04580, partial [Verrucomicrobiae bacterium]|nr:hypothetical protein [Verrucomicrobiae bacterium]